ncbi:MAG: hypothetical protein K1X74_20670 [Pirellulales bacterium]|nr:hypothetical protein [Pirellulales bacterium]
MIVARAHCGRQEGTWEFTLRTADGEEVFKAGDVEPGVTGERLELLTVVRALEALDQASCVTVITDSRYVDRGVLHGLAEWRRQGWIWECFGEWTPVKNSDLWQRLDRALEVHQVTFRRLRIDAPHALHGTHRPTDSHRDRVRLERPNPAARTSARPDEPLAKRRLRPAPVARRDAPAVEHAELLAPLRRVLNRILDGLAPA